MRAPVSATKRDRQDTGERGRGEARDTLAAHVRLSSQPTTARAARCYPTALCCRCCAFWHALCGLITRLAVTSQLGTQVRSGRHSGTQVRSGLRTETWARHAQRARVARLERRSSWLGRSGHLLAAQQLARAQRAPPSVGTHHTHTQTRYTRCLMQQSGTRNYDCRHRSSSCARRVQYRKSAQSRSALVGWVSRWSVTPFSQVTRPLCDSAGRCLDTSALLQPP